MSERIVDAAGAFAPRKVTTVMIELNIAGLRFMRSTPDYADIKRSWQLNRLTLRRNFRRVDGQSAPASESAA
jgi:hypothetical protein